jgi:hypothetical protein
MENKYSSTTEIQIKSVLNSLELWKDIFLININYYQDGWSISLREKNIYPRYIVIFKSYSLDMYSIKSFEIHFDGNKNESFKEIYFKDKLGNINELTHEIKEIIYGKDIANEIIRSIS